MKNSAWRFGCVVLLAAMACCFRNSATAADDNSNPPSGERIERLEQRINEMTQRQEQLMRRLGAAGEKPQPGMMAPREGVMPGAPLPNPASPIPPQAPPSAKFLKDISGVLHLCLLIGLVFNILLAIWIFSDIRKRGEGSGIFVALALLAGAPAAIIYSLVRLGDRKV